MSDFLVGVVDGMGYKIINARVKITIRTLGTVVGEGVTGEQGEAFIQFTALPFGAYRATATTPKGKTGFADFSVDFLGGGRAMVVNVPDSKEGSVGASAKSDLKAFWEGLGTIGQVAVVGGGVIIAYLLLAPRQQQQPIIITGR